MADISLTADGLPEADGAATTASAGGQLAREAAVVVGQVAAPVAIYFYSSHQLLTYALPAALGALVLALGVTAWAGGGLRSARPWVRVVCAMLAVAATSACLWLYAFRTLHDPGAATALCALAVVCANLAPAIGLLGLSRGTEAEAASNAITARKLPLPAVMASAEIAAICGIFLFSGSANGLLGELLFFGAMVAAIAPLLLAIQRAGMEEDTTAFCDSETQFFAVAAFMVLFALLAGFSVVGASLMSHGAGSQSKLALVLLACGMAVLSPVTMCWRQAVEDQRCPAPKRSQKTFDHIDAWAVILFALAVLLILLIALWAATSQANTDGINANWGIWTTLVVAGMFVAFAFAPHIELSRELNEGVTATTKLVAWLGHAISWLDGVLAVPIACAIGANLDRLWARYFILTLAIVPCGVLGYWLPAPYGLLAIAWGFVVTIAISRRWTWVEDDREQAMLTRNFSSSALRVGFKQDLRDEALLSFMSMFIFVPLALRQADMWAVAHGVTLFTLTDGAPNNLRTWVAFYGSELAKAVPFVDWAETYSVEGKTNVEFKDSIWAKHLVFLTRILVDLVFLGALLQAMAISARISKQREMFFGKDRDAAPYRHGNRDKRKGELDRLDPFIEAREFRRLAGPGGVIDRKVIERFPTYDSARLIALESDSEKSIMMVARALRDYQRNQDPARLSELHDTLLSAVSASGRIDKDRVVELVNALKQERFGHDVVTLRAVRGSLNNKPWANGIRRDIMTLIVGAKEQAAQRDRLEALIWCLAGDQTDERAENPEERARDARGDVRDIALGALVALMATDPAARAAIRMSAISDPSEVLKRRAKSFLDKYPDDPPAPPPTPVQGN